MNKYTVGLLAFVAGAAAGSVVTWQLLKTKYEQIAQEEIDSVKETFSRRAKKEEEQVYETEEVAFVDDKPSLEEYASIVTENKYVKEVSKDPSEGPYFITVDEYGEFDDYEVFLLTAYRDGTLVDDNDEVIDDPEGLVGEHTIFDAYQQEGDCVYVRNDEKKSDYEILLVDEVYEE